MPDSVSRNVSVSSPHETAVETLPSVKFPVDMAGADETAARMRQLPEALDRKDSEISGVIGVSSSRWANYKAGIRKISTDAALELWNVYGIPMEWTYDGQVGRIDNPDLRERLSKAHRLAMAEIAPRRASRRH